VFQQEQVEWDAVNTLLQHRGFRPVQFADPVENKNIPGTSPYVLVHSSDVMRVEVLRWF